MLLISVLERLLHLRVVDDLHDADVRRARADACAFQLVDFFVFLYSLRLEFFYHCERPRNFGLACFVLPQETAECRSELLSDERTDFFGQTTFHPETEEVKICFVFVELLVDELELIGQLVVFLCEGEEVVAANRLNNTVCFGFEHLKLLGII